MIGMSLMYRKLLAGDDEALNPSVLLPKLWDSGVRSIELRAIKPNDSASDVLRIANIMWDYGFYVTVHSTCKTSQSAVDDVFVPLRDMLSHMRQSELVITVHPVADDNVAMLIALSDHIIKHKYPVRIALENNRRMPDNTDGDSLALVLDAVTRADRKNIGTCFDMGHWAWYTANFTDTPNILPPKEFLARAIHTHIHTYAEGMTHFPLDEWREPLSLYIDALSPTYFGVYNVELTPKRYEHKWSATEAYLLSADTLKKNYPERAALYDDIRQNYDGRVRIALDTLRTKRAGCFGTLLSPTSYLFTTNGYRWAMDVSFLHLRKLAKAPSLVREYLGDIDCMLLTHAHGDHMEEKTVRALADTDIAWCVPEFLLDKVLSFGVRREKITSVSAGDTVRIGPLTIRVLEGRHFRQARKGGIDAVGYLVSADNAPTIAFPSDVRDYSVADGDELCADHCFAHVWLTDRALEPESYIPKSREFAEFMLQRSRKSIFLTHLYIHRSDDKRWTLKHARVAGEAIRALSPETVVRVPRYGEVIDLSAEE